MPVDNAFGPLDAAHGYSDPMNSRRDIRLSCLLFGLFLGLDGSVLPNLFEATGLHKRPVTFSFFKFLIWLQWVVCTIYSVISWCRFQHYIKPSFAYFSMLEFLWAIQVQCLAQIAANRIGILLSNNRLKRRVKLGLFCLVWVLSALSMVTWLPVSVHVKDPVYHNMLIPINCVIMGAVIMVDVGLNVWFVVMVKKRLIDLGLRKYDSLVRRNMVLLLLAVSLDALTLGLMFLSNPTIYVHIYSLSYVSNLAIELSLSSLIGKIAAKGVSSPVPVQSSVSHQSTTQHIHVLVEQNVDEQQEQKVEVLPAFGKFIKRPQVQLDRKDPDGSVDSCELDGMSR